MKSNCTTALREHDAVFQNRPVWSVGGDWRCVNSEVELYRVIEYVRDAQERKFLDHPDSETGR